jgi:hypothetical protein
MLKRRNLMPGKSFQIEVYEVLPEKEKFVRDLLIAATWLIEAHIGDDVILEESDDAVVWDEVDREIDFGKEEKDASEGSEPVRKRI